MTIKVAIKIREKKWLDDIKEIRSVVKKAASQAWKFGNVGDLEIPVDDAEISILLTDDEEVHSLNREYRGVDRTTNVLSFASLDDEFEVIDSPLLLGDIIVAYGKTKEEAEEEKISLQSHLFHLVVHGVLHLIGYDHIEEAEAEEMESKEIEILSRNRIANPYA